ncbi:MAG: ThuA domain-containing protein [Acidimicrobiales bacterium]|jgi:hypothetical protein
MTVAAFGSAPVFALIGDRYHNVDYIRVNFDRLFAELGLRYEYTTNYEWFGDEQNTAKLLEGRKLFIFGRDALVFPDGYVGPGSSDGLVTGLMNAPPRSAAGTWVTEGLAVAVDRFVRAGGSLFSWHNNLSVSNYSVTYRRVTGGAYDGHPPERPWKVEVVNGNHPITQSVADFMVTDEQHFPIYDRPEADLLLRGANIDGLTFDTDSGAVKGATVSATAWAHAHGEGRVVVSEVGHNLDALWKPAYWQFQKNAVRWLLGEI